MKPLFCCFYMLIKQISKDCMLYAILLAPLMAACVFRFGIPYAETLLCAYFEKTSILAGYYLLFDILLAILTPVMFCFSSSMVILTEYDENITNYIVSTPVGKRGYIISRIVFPTGLSFFVTAILLSLFALTKWQPLMLLLTVLLTCLLSVVISLLIISYSHNRVEGMAMAKLSGVIFLGLPIPFFMSSNIQYLFSLLPSFWIGKLCLERNYLFVIPALMTSFLMIWALYRRLEKKLV